MVKSWADHSSDEEDALEDAHQTVPVANPNVLKQEFEAETRAMQQQGGDPTAGGNRNNSNAADNSHENSHAPSVRTYEYPTQAPFTAYVGNLAYSLVDSAQLKEGLVELVQSVLGMSSDKFVIVDARLMMERNALPGDAPRHRGFGYVEVETLEMLQTLMELNERKALLAGRQPVLDPQTNAPKGRGGGRSSSGGGGRGGGSFPDGGQFRGGRFASGDAPPKVDDGRQRPSLKLAPRSAKPSGAAAPAVAQASLFGGGKARDEKSWQERRQTQGRGAGGRGDRRRPKEGGGKEGGFGSGRGGDRTHKEGGRGGDRTHKEGGRGGDRTHKESGRGGGGHKEGGRGRGPRAAPAKETKEGGWHDKPAHSKGGEAPVVKTAPVPVPVKAAEAPVEKKVVNKFAALDFSDSD